MEDKAGHARSDRESKEHVVVDLPSAQELYSWLQETEDLLEKTTRDYNYLLEENTKLERKEYTAEYLIESLRQDLRKRTSLYSDARCNLATLEKQRMVHLQIQNTYRDALKQARVRGDEALQSLKQVHDVELKLLKVERQRLRSRLYDLNKKVSELEQCMLEKDAQLLKQQSKTSENISQGAAETFSEPETSSSLSTLQNPVSAVTSKPKPRRTSHRSFFKVLSKL